jgi:hypothetical protein
MTGRYVERAADPLRAVADQVAGRVNASTRRCKGGRHRWCHCLGGAELSQNQRPARFRGGSVGTGPHRMGPQRGGVGQKSLSIGPLVNRVRVSGKKTRAKFFWRPKSWGRVLRGYLMLWSLRLDHLEFDISRHWGHFQWQLMCWGVRRHRIDEAAPAITPRHARMGRFVYIVQRASIQPI